MSTGEAPLVPMVDGVPVAAFPPEGWVEEHGPLSLENPMRTRVMEHYLIFGVMGTLAFIALCQRFYTKMFLSKGLAIDDLFMALAWATSLTTQSLMVNSIVRKTLGVHMWENNLELFLEDTLNTYVTAGIFMLCNGCTKLSLLTFYLQLSPQKWWKTAVWSGIGVVALATTIITTMLYFHCSPVEKAYKPLMEEGSCLDVGILYMATAVANIVTDVYLFCLPIPMVLQLKMGTFQKIGAIVIFGIGSMTVATSVVRMVYLLKVLNAQDLTWDAAKANVWSLVEANLFIICGSMPTLRKFFKHFAPKLMGGSTGNSTSAKYGINGYAYGTGGDRRLENGTGASRKMRRQYENFDDHEMGVFETRGRDSDGDGKNGMASETIIDAGSEKINDNSSDKAILQTKTFDVRYN